MKKVVSVVMALAIAVGMMAVPAKRGWQTKTQPDGTTIRVELRGDEFYHYWVDENGNQVQQDENGYWQIKGSAPTAEQVARRRSASPMKMMPRRAVGTKKLSEEGLVILVNFSDKSLGGTQSDFYNLLNGENYTYNGAVGSVKKYFSDQSNGQYVPKFTVVGPVTLDKKYSYYGDNGSDGRGGDIHLGDMIAEACMKAHNSGVDFSQFDANGDNCVDFVYIIYAGLGEADGGADGTVWPCSWSLDNARYYSSCSYTVAQCTFDGKKVNDFACSAELCTNGNRSQRDGIGTICHEFSHVIGLPDYYDTDYEDNGDNDDYIPGIYSLMCSGSYNDHGNCPPSYSAFDKYFMGWATPKILNAPANVTITPSYDDIYQINNAGSLAAYTSTSVQYYLEYRQKTGWDKALPGSGMLVWKVQYNSSKWNSNDLNAYSGTVLYSIVSAGGAPKVLESGADYFPGTKRITSWTPFSKYPLTGITEGSGNVSFIFISSPDCHNVVTNGTNCTISPSATCITNGSTLTANITPKDASYDITSVSVKRGSTTLSNGTDYTLENNNTFLTVNSTAISGAASNDITITATATQNRWMYNVLTENATVSSEEGAVTKGGQLQLTITPALGYVITSGEHIEVTMGGVDLVWGTGYTYIDGQLTIPNVTGNVEIYVFPGIDPENMMTFMPVTDAAMLGNGSKVIMVYPSTPAVAGTTLYSGYLNSQTEGVTANTDGTLTVDKTKVSIFTIGGSAGAFSLTDQQNNVLATSGANFAYDGGAKWAITITSNGMAEMKYNNGYPVYYNSGSPRFKPYSSAQKSIALYIDASSIGQQDNSISFNQAGPLTTKINTPIYNKATATFGTPVYSSSNTNVATVDQSGNVTPKSVGTTTITATVAEATYYKGAVASYQLTVQALEQYTMTWKNGTSAFTTTTVTEGETLALPTTSPAACSNGKVFVGWTTNYPYDNQTTAPTYVQDGAEVTSANTYYAVFAVKKQGTAASKTATQETFSTISGNLNGDENITYAASQGDASTAPGVYTNQIRIYQKGGLLTLNASEGKITAVTMGSSSSTVVQVKYDNGSYGDNINISSGSPLSLSGLNVSKVTIKNVGTTSTQRINVNRLSVTYTSGTADTYTYFKTDCDGEVVITKEDPTFQFANAAVELRIGDQYTNTLTETTDAAISYSSSDNASVSVDNNGQITANKVCQNVTITASAPATSTYNAAVASYTVSVLRKQVTASFATSSYNKQVGDDNFTQTVTITPVEYDGQVAYSSNDETVATVNAATGEVTIVGEGSATITATLPQTNNYVTTSASYTILVEAGDTPITTGCDGKKISSDYYADLDGLSGEELFDAIHTVAKKGYKGTLSYNDLWTAYCAIDINAAGYVWDMYSDATSYVCGGSKQGANYSKEGDAYNREHSIPKSWFGSSESANTPGSDLFLVVPADGYVNNRRSNNTLGVVSSASYTSESGCRVGTPSSIDGQSCSTSTVFEPMDKYKGDFARIYMGAMVRWAGDYQAFTSQDGAAIFSGNYTSAGHFGLTQYGVALLMKWHKQDPVSKKEIDRNDGIQEQQGNRNPFVDYPELADYLWGDMSNQAFSTATATDVTFCTDYEPGGSEVTKWTITWSADGSTTDVQYIEGSKLVLPSAPANCSEERVFRGWTASEITTATDVQPAFIQAGTTINAGATYYAVYANMHQASNAPQRVVAPHDNAVWYETFGGFSKDDQPSASNEETYVYGDASLTYGCQTASTKIYEEALAGGETPELLLAKSSSFTITGIPVAEATRMSLTFKSNHADLVTVSSTTPGVSVSGNGNSWSITISNNTLQTLDLTMRNTNSKSNTRVDDIQLVIEEGGSSWITTYSAYSTNCSEEEETTYTATIGVADGYGDQGTVTGGGSDLATNQNVTITATPNTGYRFTRWVDGSGNTVSTDNPYTFKITDTDVALYAQFEAATSLTVIWMSDNDEIERQNYYEGDALTLPSTTPSECNGKTFQGWTGMTNYFSPTLPPSDMFKTAGGKTVTEDKTYYAVFKQ